MPLTFLGERGDEAQGELGEAGVAPASRRLQNGRVELGRKNHLQLDDQPGKCLIAWLTTLKIHVDGFESFSCCWGQKELLYIAQKEFRNFVSDETLYRSCIMAP